MRTNTLTSMIGSHFQKLDEFNLMLVLDSDVGGLEGLIKHFNASYFLIFDPE